LGTYLARIWNGFQGIGPGRVILFIIGIIQYLICFFLQFEGTTWAQDNEIINQAEFQQFEGLVNFNLLNFLHEPA
jgi:hypothetical protein